MGSTLTSLGAALEWLEEAYEDAHQSLIDGAVASAVLVTSLLLMPYVDGGGLIVGLAFIGAVHALDLATRTGRGLVGLVRRAPSRALHQ